MHVTQGTLRAYLDGELDAAHVERVAAHLRDCSRCRAELSDLSAHSAAARQAIGLLAPGAAESLSPMPVALARFKQTRASRRADARAGEPGALNWIQKGVTTMFNTRLRPVWATVALVAVVALLLSLAPVRAAASQFLGLFRVRKFAVVSVDPALFTEDFNSAAVQEQIAQMLSDDVDTLREPQEPVTVASADEASQKAGIPVRLPAALGAPKAIEVQNGFEMRYRFNAERVRTVLEYAHMDEVQLPPGLDGALVHVDVQPIVAATYGSDEDSVRLRNNMVLIQAASPSVDLPPGVDVDKLGEMLLQVWGLPPDEARQAAAKIDWTSTLVIPLPTKFTDHQEVLVGDSPGLFVRQFEEDGVRRFALLWHKDDVVYALMGDGTLERALEIANSMP
ncbi:MAG: zf-HC2 domain-containing protein [Thermoflexales bacterium]|nr:zf-HC2 domain-containing protein [Thermoflexales bacterium]